MGDETEVIHVEENGDESHDVRVGKGEVGVVSLDRVDEVGDAESQTGTERVVKEGVT